MHPIDVVHQAVKDLLATSGVPGDLGRKPAAGGWQDTPGSSAFVPYWILYGTSARGEATLASLHAHGHTVVQISSFAATSGGAGATASRLRVLMPSLVVPGLAVSSVEQILSRGPQPDHDISETATVFTVVEQFDIWTT